MLARYRMISAGLLALLVVLAWAWLLSGAGMGMAPRFALWPQSAPATAMPGMAMPGMAMPGMPMPAGPPPWTMARFLVTLAMWWIMMAAMMLPSAAPVILLFARAAGPAPRPRPATEAFLAGYLVVWGAFSLAATLLQWQFGRLDLVAPMGMASTSTRVDAAILLLAGLYQLTPLKDACLSQCRNPAQFLSRNYQPGWRGALRMGWVHGAFCVGCCWLLMALLFVGGVMNVVWIAVLTVLVAVEKLVPRGRLVGAGLGIVLMAGGIAILLR